MINAPAVNSSRRGSSTLSLSTAIKVSLSKLVLNEMIEFTHTLRRIISPVYPQRGREKTTGTVIALSSIIFYCVLSILTETKGAGTQIVQVSKQMKQVECMIHHTMGNSLREREKRRKKQMA